MSLDTFSANTQTGIGTDTTIKVDDPYSTAFESAQREQLQKEFKETLDPSKDPEVTGVSLEGDPVISVKKEYTLGEGLGSLVEGLSQEELKEKRKKEAEERAKYTPYIEDIFPETPTVDLSAFSEAKTEATSLADQLSRTLSVRDRGPVSAQLGLLEEDATIGLRDLPDIDIKSSWLADAIETSQDYWSKAKTAYGVGEEIYDVGEKTWDYLSPASDSISILPSTAYGATQGYGGTQYLTEGMQAGLSDATSSAISSAYGATQGYGGTQLLDESWLARNVPSMSATMNLAGKALAIYNVVKVFRDEDAGGQAKFNAIASAAVTLAESPAWPLMVIQGLQTLFAYAKSRRGKPKFAFGGADIVTEGGHLKATKGYGYNNYNVKAGQAGAASFADYINTMTDHFGQTFYGPAWKQAVAANPRMGRYDTRNLSGYADLSTLIRLTMEAPGVIQGAPKVNGQSITTQDQYEKAIIDFNKHYQEKAIERGGLYRADLAASDQVDFSNLKREGVPDQINFAQQHTAQERKNMQELTTRSWSTGYSSTETGVGHWKPGGRAGPTWVPYSGPTHTPQGPGNAPIPIKLWDEDVTSPYDILYYNLVGKFNRGSGGTGY